ncbi:chitin disaccharide deacetylase [Salmonella enterica subsp. salamae]|nr:chitin disaccharide deacetylase [Salmonella enterica subsp. salamae]ECJ2281711.1 chitin disaccharide deacetylase [Salmonella enterica subsp. salamae]HCC0889739.1 chitin disaccharide deacetylase [Salmonella enterica]
MTKLLIVNADDFGLSPGINYGIIEAHRHGLVTSTTAMMNAGSIEQAAEISADFPLLGVGLHFVLSFGAPLSSMPSLERDGILGKWLWQAAEQEKIQDDEIVAELHSQYDYFVRLFGRKPTHIDSHHHAHFIPQVWKHVVRFAGETGLPLRVDRQRVISTQGVKCVDNFISNFYAENVSARFILAALTDATAGEEQSVELMCHPGFIDKIALQSSYCYPRLDELDVLTSATLKHAILAQGFRLGTYGDLP